MLRNKDGWSDLTSVRTVLGKCNGRREEQGKGREGRKDMMDHVDKEKSQERRIEGHTVKK